MSEPETEFELLQEHIKDKSQATIKSYMIAYKRMRQLLDDEEIADCSQKKILQVIMDGDINLNSAQSLINIAVIVRQFSHESVLTLERQRYQNRIALAQHVKEKNKLIENTLPSLETLCLYTDSLYANSQFKEFIINYLLLNYQTRNADLVFTIVGRKMDASDPTKNYIWLRNRVATYIRRHYKTAQAYGEKVHKITDAKFITALRRVINLQKIDDEKGVFIPTISQAGYYIQKYTYNELGETKYVKIVIDHFRSDLQKLREIADNRGTDLSTLAASYDIKNV